MRRRLLVVEDTFRLRGRGLVLVPSLESGVGEELVGRRLDLELVAPGDGRRTVTGCAQLEHLNPAGFRHVCILDASCGAPVDAGTEVWFEPHGARGSG